VLASDVEPLGNGQAVSVVEVDDSGFPTLVETSYDQQANAIIEVRKTVVNNTGATGSADNGVVTEYQPIDKWRTIQMVSKFLTEPTTKSFQGSVSVPLPSVLQDIAVYFHYSIMQIEGDRWRGGLALQPYMNIVSPPSPPYLATIEEFFTKEPAAITATSTQFSPQSVTVPALLSLVVSGDAPEGVIATFQTVKAFSVSIPECLMPASTIEVRPWPGMSNPLPAWASYQVATPPALVATTPSSLDGEITYVWPPERYRFGYYYVRRATFTLSAGSVSSGGGGGSPPIGGGGGKLG
jgi:hypothetical protein